jgi:hypothetical protein
VNWSAGRTLLARGSDERGQYRVVMVSIGPGYEILRVSRSIWLRLMAFVERPRVSCDYGGLLLPVHQDDPRSVARVAASCAAREGWGRRFISLSTSVQSARAPRTIISVTSTDMTGSLCFRYRIEMSGLVQGQDVSGSGLRPLVAAATLPNLLDRAKYLFNSANVGEPQGSPRSRCRAAAQLVPGPLRSPFS